VGIAGYPENSTTQPSGVQRVRMQRLLLDAPLGRHQGGGACYVGSPVWRDFAVYPVLAVSSLLLGCSGGRAADDVHAGGDALPVMMSPEDQLTRVSMALRGLRPSPDELHAVRADPDSLEAYVDVWLDSDDFGRNIRDMHAQQFLLRTDTVEPLPSFGPLTNDSSFEIFTSTTEAPLRLVEHVVMNDMPYTEMLTLDYMFKDRIVSDIYGLPYDLGGDTWQIGQWMDGRPHAGILTSSEMWRRYRSAGENYNRKRANFVADVLLCEAFASRDIVLPSGLDLSDEQLVLDAVNFNPACVGCHQAMDPVAAFFWGFRGQIKGRGVRLAYGVGCVTSPGDEPPLEGGVQEDTCYPLRMYQPDEEQRWAEIGLRPPAFFGQPGERLDDLAEMIVDDPRFATCTSRRFWSWFTQSDVSQTDLALTTELTEVFTESNFDAKALTKAIVTHPRFLTDHMEGEGPAPYEPVGAMLVRPEQYHSALLDLTGFQWWALPDELGCTSQCWSVVDLSNSDRYGFRSMAGGVDGLQVTRPSYRSIPTTPLVHHRTSSEAAAWVVGNDFLVAPEERHLLRLIEPGDEDEGRIREQLVELHLTISSEVVASDSPQVDLSFQLWAGAMALHGNTYRAWTLTLTALLQDARMVFY